MEEAQESDKMRLSRAIASKDANEMVEICQEAELTSAQVGKTHPHAREHMLSLLLTDDLTEARFLWRRLPEEVRPQVEPTWRLTQALWRKDRAQFFRVAEAEDWNEGARPLVDELVCRIRGRAIELIRRAYSVVPVEMVARLVGVRVQDVPDLATSNGWRVEGGFVVSGMREDGSACDDDKKAVGGGGEQVPFAELQMLTEQLVKLQTS